MSIKKSIALLFTTEKLTLEITQAEISNKINRRCTGYHVWGVPIMNQDVYDGPIKHRKRSKKRPPAKAGHKHDFQPCMFQTYRKHFDRVHGYVQTGEPSFSFGSYCPICGKTSRSDIDQWLLWVPLHPGSQGGRFEYTDRAKAELDPATRTLPTFIINDRFPPKYVSLENQTKEN